MSRRSSAALRLAGLAALVAVLLGGAGLVFRRFVAEPAAGGARPRPGAPAATAVPSARGGAAVLDVEGRVERRTGRDRWTDVAPGDVVEPEHALRTGPGAQAHLALGPGARLQVDERTVLEVCEVGPALHHLRVEQGRVGVDYAELGERRVRIDGPGGATAAAARGARFDVVSTGGLLAVATETGGVDLSSEAGVVHLGKGERSSAAAGAPPAPPEPIPVHVVLKVASALAAAGDGGCDRLAGQVEPGTELRLDGEVVPVADDGSFDVRPGPRSHALRLRARDVAGRVVERDVPCRAAAPEPVIDLSVQWGLDERP